MTTAHRVDTVGLVGVALARRLTAPDVHTLAVLAAERTRCGTGPVLTNERLAELMRTSESTASRRVARLRRRGLVLVERRQGRRLPSRYDLGPLDAVLTSAARVARETLA